VADCVQDMRGAPLTDEQWSRVAPLLESYDEHVSADDGNHLYLDQIFIKAGIPNRDDTEDRGDAAA